MDRGIPRVGFDCSLPVASGTSQGQRSKSGTATSSNRLHVLVVEDNKDSADSVAMLVRLGGHDVRVAYSGHVALLMAEQQTPDVVLLDIGLPRLNGYEVARSLRNRPETKDALIIAVTGHGEESDVEQSEKAGINLHLVKPVDNEQLIRLLRENLSPRSE